eukprot:scaffold60051_cov59-Phaeocystis_antarctica.AAC.3
MQYMFGGASAFDQPLSFDTSGVTTMFMMFLYAGAFNQPLSFDTSSVTSMAAMFQSASAFNRPLSFDTSSVTTMSVMFYVRSSPRALLPICRRSLPCTLRAPLSPAAWPACPARTSLHASYALRSTLGRPQTPCPPPTSCSSVARSALPLVSYVNNNKSQGSATGSASGGPEAPNVRPEAR